MILIISLVVPDHADEIPEKACVTAIVPADQPYRV
jgi:hypothetical protein